MSIIRKSRYNWCSLLSPSYLIKGRTKSWRGEKWAEIDVGCSEAVPVELCLICTIEIETDAWTKAMHTQKISKNDERNQTGVQRRDKKRGIHLFFSTEGEVCSLINILKLASISTKKSINSRALFYTIFPSPPILWVKNQRIINSDFTKPSLNLNVSFSGCNSIALPIFIYDFFWGSFTIDKL